MHTMSTMEIDEKYIEVEKMLENCDSGIATSVLELDEAINKAYRNEEIDKYSADMIQRRTNIFTRAFRLNCSCKGKKR